MCPKAPPGKDLIRVAELEDKSLIGCAAPSTAHPLGGGGYGEVIIAMDYSSLEERVVAVMVENRDGQLTVTDEFVTSGRRSGKQALMDAMKRKFYNDHPGATCITISVDDMIVEKDITPRSRK